MRTRLGMKAFHAMPRSMDVIVQKGEDYEEAVRIAPGFFQEAGSQLVGW